MFFSLLTPAIEKTKTLIVVGDTRSGKSSIISSLHSNPSEKIPKPTQGVDFFSMNRAIPGGKIILKIYEIGGGRKAENLLNVSFSKEDFPSTNFLIVLDFSKPSKLLESLLFWLRAIRNAVEISLYERLIIYSLLTHLILHFRNFGENIWIKFQKFQIIMS